MMGSGLLSARVSRLRDDHPVLGGQSAADLLDIPRPARCQPGGAPLTVLLGADSLSRRRSGIGRMTVEIGRAMRRQPDIEAFRLLVDGRWHDDSLLDNLPEYEDGGQASGADSSGAKALLRSHIGVFRTVRALRSRVMRAKLAEAVRGLGTDTIYHEPNMIAKAFDGITVPTFNDLSWRTNPAWHPAERVAWIERHLPATLAQATRFVAISHFTAEAMTTELGIPAARIDVIPLAPSGVFRPMQAAPAEPVLLRHGLADRRYVLSVSTREPRKNFDALLRAHASLPDALAQAHPLVIAGGDGWGATLTDSLADQQVRLGRLRLLGHVPDAELACLVARCSAFAYVSLYEGFGLPVLEAMAAGAPVIASATTGTGETAAQAAILVEPGDDRSIAEALRRVLDDEVLATRLRAAGTRRAASFSWDLTVSRLCDTWRRASGTMPS